ncbi:MAG: GTP 3',8-cyclase MoaA [Desulfobacterales bacterium]
MHRDVPQTLIDPCNRRLNYLRISVTDRCNLRCAYCTPLEDGRRLEHAEILRYEEILRLVRIGVRLGIEKIRITGGEPLLRRDLPTLLAGIHRLPGIRDLSLTTNGLLLEEHLERLIAAGLRRVNVSLDTLKRERYREITGVDALGRVLAAIDAALAAGLHPVKINVVALPGVNEDELLDLARLSLARPLHVRFIEFMPIGRSRLSARAPLLVPEIRRRLAPLGELAPVPRDEMDGPAQRWRVPGAAGEIGFIPAISHHFCRRCNRLRLTAAGSLRPCLLSDREEDLKGPLRAGATDEELAAVFLAATRHKPSDHALAAGEAAHVCCQMQSIGG